MRVLRFPANATRDEARAVFFFPHFPFVLARAVHSHHSFLPYARLAYDCSRKTTRFSALFSCANAHARATTRLNRGSSPAALSLSLSLSLSFLKIKTEFVIAASSVSPRRAAPRDK